jgi:hypothetical protein
MESQIPFGIRAGKLIHISELDKEEKGLKCKLYLSSISIRPGGLSAYMGMKVRSCLPEIKII